MYGHIYIYICALSGYCPSGPIYARTSTGINRAQTKKSAERALVYSTRIHTHNYYLRARRGASRQPDTVGRPTPSVANGLGVFVAGIAPSTHSPPVTTPSELPGVVVWTQGPYHPAVGWVTGKREISLAVRSSKRTQRICVEFPQVTKIPMQMKCVRLRHAVRNTVLTIRIRSMLSTTIWYCKQYTYTPNT